MHNGGHVLRQFCSARNAYSPSAALCSTICPQPKSHIQSRNYQIAATYRGQRKPITIFSKEQKSQSATTPDADHETPQDPSSVESVLEQDKQSLDYGGKYEHQPSKEGKVRKLITMGAERNHHAQHDKQQSKSRNKAESVTEQTGDSSWYSLQAHMRKLAADAGQLANMKVKLSETELINERRKKLGYIGRYIAAEKSPFDEPLPVPWALDLTKAMDKKSKQLLEEEVRLFAEYMEPTPAEKVARQAVILQLTGLLAQQMGPGVHSELFGSERTGLALAISDIDIRLDCDIEDPDAKWQYLIDRMKPLTKVMSESHEYMLVVARWGRYPIINAQHKRTGIHIQIVAAPSSAPQDAVTLQYLNDFPHLRALYVLFRAALGTRGLVDVYNGGTGSYGLFIMLVASIKRRSSDRPTTLSDQLFRCLDFYASLNKSLHGVSVSPPKLFKKHNPWEAPIKDFVEAARRRGDLVRSAQWAISQRRLYQPYLLCLQDPANPHNDLGRKSNAIKHITSTLNGIRSDLLSDLKSAGAAASKGQPYGRESILLRMVGRCHEVYHERRRRVEEYGLEVMALKKQALEEEKNAGKGTGELVEAVG